MQQQHDTVAMDEVNLSVQFLLNCGANVAGSCHGGSATGAYDFIANVAGHVPFDTCQPYLACSHDSKEEGFCRHVDTSCSAVNTCRTCWPKLNRDETDFISKCKAVHRYPNATIAEYGTYRDIAAHQVYQLQAEIWMRGPIKASVDATPLVNYSGGVIWADMPEYNASTTHNHGVSIVGWGYDADGDGDGDDADSHNDDDDEEKHVKKNRQYWIVRNSWYVLRTGTLILSFLLAGACNESCAMAFTAKTMMFLTSIVHVYLTFKFSSNLSVFLAGGNTGANWAFFVSKWERIY
jgi:cathepsin X